MARPRKTIPVERVREMANAMLENSTDPKRDARFGVAHLLEQVLMETGNYKGFGFEDGMDGRRDASRRRYYR